MLQIRLNEVLRGRSRESLLEGRLFDATNERRCIEGPSLEYKL